jgi:hypothetical protein
MRRPRGWGERGKVRFLSRNLPGPARGLGGYPARVPCLESLKLAFTGADSETDSRLGTDGNQEPAAELREGAADDAALLTFLACGQIGAELTHLLCQARVFVLRANRR